ncbi:hypothetical protein B1992_14055 [Pseudoxanthomonas broegbernensis]|uniref:Outer membrane protein beta-barrel domain-containing protein n=1 Tax=Pseudoxanthomonas broegbernensis TaxID=83619 RepID=A0A7V8GK80_9GAMM|nr:hypothetical protein [Pseudoxanthomonas broegbernensis]KAF1684838.1 hypothetical protein B1992_14055 [Pseudoxanthomonas broegbernensis]MBB6065288.1 hypothetical protein [Pseudoxanthomonas broegbernensis]
MMIDSKAGCLAVLATLAMAVPAHAQNSPWWDGHKDEAAVPGTAQSQAAAAPGRAAPAAAGPGYTYVEAGAARLDVDMYGLDESGNGGYARGSVALPDTDGLYLFGGYDRVSQSWNAGDERLKVAIDQAELGFGARLSLSSRTDFFSELSLLRLGARVDYEDRAYPQEGIRGSDHLQAGKLMLGIRGRPSPHAELWAKAGYVRVDDNLLIESSAVGNVGVQFKITPTWGLVGEAEFYDDLRFYRLGVRASF